MFFVYILASRPYGTLYVGVTSNFPKRIFEHKTKVVPGFTTRYGVDKLVWFEARETAEAAIQREKRIKEWRRGWKISLIESDNPHWIDLYPGLSPWLTRLAGPCLLLCAIPAKVGVHFRPRSRPSPGRREIYLPSGDNNGCVRVPYRRNPILSR